MYTLNLNERYPSLQNVIISIENRGFTVGKVTDDLGKYAERERVDGSLYGDQKVYRKFQKVNPRKWSQSAVRNQLFNDDKIADPKEQTITLNDFRYAVADTDNILSKRIYFTEGTFAEFNSATKAAVYDAKETADRLEMVAYLGTMESSVQGTKTVDVSTAISGLTGDEKNRAYALETGRQFKAIMDDVKDYTTKYNDYGLKQCGGDVEVIWNLDYVNKFEKTALPVTFHKDGLFNFTDTLPAHYFGNVNASATVGDGSTIYSMKSTWVSKEGSDDVFVDAGSLIPEGYTALAGESYTVDSTILCIIKGKGNVPLMSACVRSDEFHNPLSQEDKHIVIWGKNTLEYLKDTVVLKVKIQEA